MRFDEAEFVWIADTGAELACVNRLNQPEWRTIRPNGQELAGPWHPGAWAETNPQGARLTIHGGRDNAGWRFNYLGATRAPGAGTRIYHFRYDEGEDRLREIPDAPELDLASLLAPPSRLPPYRIQYETAEEAHLRLHGCVILIKGHPFSVENVGGPNNNIALNVRDPKGKKHRVLLRDIPDLRAAAPRYVTWEGCAYFLTRAPQRVYQQGMNQSNTFLKRAGSDSLCGISRESLLDVLQEKKPLPWTESLNNLLRDGHVKDLRLSEDISVYAKRRSLYAEFRGRNLGLLNDNDVKFDFEDDISCPWITKALKKVDLKGYHDAP